MRTKDVTEKQFQYIDSRIGKDSLGIGKSLICISA